MDVTIRPASEQDIEACGEICFEAFRAIATQHGFIPDFPSAEIPKGLLAALHQHPGFYGVVAEVDGVVVGSNFVDERGPVGGIGPVTVALQMQDRGIGRMLMEHLVQRGNEKGMPLRLTQAAYHARSLSLYAKLGFEVREPLCVMRGDIHASLPAERTVRAATHDDRSRCSVLCRSIHGHDRDGELLDAINQGSAMVVEGAKGITGYATLIGYFGYAIAESNHDLKALIAASGAIQGPGFLLPARNAELMEWCLENGLRIGHVATLMSRGEYHEPEGAFLPSILY